MTSLTGLTATIEAAPTPDAKLDALLQGLAERIKATSNDQNIQKLARELRAATPDLIRAVAADAPTTSARRSA